MPSDKINDGRVMPFPCREQTPGGYREVRGEPGHGRRDFPNKPAPRPERAPERIDADRPHVERVGYGRGR